MVQAGGSLVFDNDGDLNVIVVKFSVSQVLQEISDQN